MFKVFSWGRTRGTHTGVETRVTHRVRTRDVGTRVRHGVRTRDVETRVRHGGLCARHSALPPMESPLGRAFPLVQLVRVNYSNS